MLKITHIKEVKSEEVFRYNRKWWVLHLFRKDRAMELDEQFRIKTDNPERIDVPKHIAVGIVLNDKGKPTKCKLYS